MPQTPTAARPRWVTVFAGFVVGVLTAVVGFFVVGVASDESVEPVTTAFSLSDEVALAPGPVTLIAVRDVRQASSIPGDATGQRMLDRIGGRVRGLDPYWIMLHYPRRRGRPQASTWRSGSTARTTGSPSTRRGRHER